MTAALRCWRATMPSCTSGRRATRRWRERESLDRPVRSGAESFIAGTASCRIETAGVDDLYVELAQADVLHPVSRDGVSETDYGTREFATVDLDGNLVTFFEWQAER